MKTLIVLAFLTGMDNLAVSAALGLRGMTRARRQNLAVLFGAFEGLMPVVGWGLAAYLPRPTALAGLPTASAAWAACLGLVLLVVWRRKSLVQWVRAGRGVYLLPLLLSFDNLFAGLGFGELGYSLWFSALTIGVVSGLIAYFGMLAGDKAAAALPAYRRQLRWAGVFIAAAALFVELA